MQQPMPWIIGAAGSILGGLTGSRGQASANRTNLRIARENREWQQMMSSTAYQRATRDLEGAGLNRILALGGPSSTPAGNIATMQNAKKQLGESITGGMSTALQAQQIKNMEAQRQLTIAQKDALKPAAEIGEGVGGMLDTGKKFPTFIAENLLKLLHGGAPGDTGPALPTTSKQVTTQQDYIKNIENEHRLKKARLTNIIKQYETQRS